MTLPQELMDSAQAFGEALNQSETVQRYLQAQEKLKADAELYAQEQQLQDLYNDLVARQRSDERLSQTEVDEFNALKEKVQSQPLVRARDTALGALKTTFADAAGKLNAVLGVDYTSLAQS